MAILTGNDIYKVIDNVMDNVIDDIQRTIENFDGMEAGIDIGSADLDFHMWKYSNKIHGFEFFTHLRFYLDGEDWILDSRDYDGCETKYATVDADGFVHRTENTNVPFPFTMDHIDMILVELENGILKNRRKAGENNG